MHVPQLVLAVLVIACGLVTSRPGRAQCAEWDAGFGMPGMNASVHALAVHDDGSGPALYAAGAFSSAGGVSADRIAKSDGTGWSALGSGMNDDVHALATHDDGSGPALYAAGAFSSAGGVGANSIAKWNGTTWSALGAGMNGPVSALTVFDDGSGPALYAGGDFTTAGGVSANRIAKWNGTSWSALAGGMNAEVRALTVFDDGAGPLLHAGGSFTDGGPFPAVAKWTGTSWVALAGQMNGAVLSLAAYDDGTGSALYAGGVFTTVGGMSLNKLARWNGASWSALDGGLVGNEVNALTVSDDLAGRVLYVGGRFQSAGGVSTSSIAKWDGFSWSALGSGVSNGPPVNTLVYALAVFDDGTDGAPHLFAGGEFVEAGGHVSNYVGKWRGCEHEGGGYCFGDGLDPLVTVDCPCSNFGNPGRGCANSNFNLGGASLAASGTTTPNTLLLTCAGIPNNTLCTFLRSPNHDTGAALFGDGITCLTAPLFRFGSQHSGQLGNPPNTVESAVLTQSPGNTAYYMLQYRNPNPAFCPPGLFNASNAYRLSW